MTKSMTEGKPLSLILQFAFPLLLGNLFQQTYNMVDAAIVGQSLGADALAALGSSSSVQFLVLGFGFGNCAGFGIPVAQAFGSKDESQMRQYIYLGSLVTAVMAVVLTLLCAVLCAPILHMLQTPEEIFEEARSYLLILFLGIPCSLLYNYCSGILRAVGDSRTPFLFLVFSALLNIVLDLFCIMVLGWGVAGAAIATVFSQGTSGVLCVLYIKKKFKMLIPEKEERKMNGAMVKKLVVMGLPMGLQFSITAIGSMVMQSANNSLGKIYVSGFTAGMKIKQFAMCPFDAIGTGVSTFVGQNYGAGKNDRIRKGIRAGISSGVIYGAAIGLVMIFFGRDLSKIFVASSYSEVLDASAKYLRCLGYCYWMLGILNISRLAIQGLGFSARSIFSGVSEMIARTLVSLIAVPLVGYTGICWADQTAWIMAVLYLLPTLFYCLKKIDRCPYRSA